MLSHAQIGAPLFGEVRANAHTRVPLSCSTFPRPNLVQRRAFYAGLGEKQLAGSGALKAMVPLMTDGAETQSAGPAGEFAKLKVCLAAGLPVPEHIVRHKTECCPGVIGMRSWTTR